MGEVKNLISKEAIEKLKKLAMDADITMFATNLKQSPVTVRPMSTQQVDEDGNLWFLSRNDSNKNREIAQDNRVQLFYSNKGDSEYLSVYGMAEILRNKKKIEELWNPIIKAWFNEGKDDPSITLLKVIPQDVYYWDTKQNKLVTLIKLAYGAVTGKPVDDGIEGNISV